MFPIEIQNGRVSSTGAQGRKSEYFFHQIQSIESFTLLIGIPNQSFAEVVLQDHVREQLHG
jgi:hypothetical protein